MPSSSLHTCVCVSCLRLDRGYCDCGMCECDDGWFGDACQFQEECNLPSKKSKELCKNPQGVVCSNRGTAATSTGDAWEGGNTARPRHKHQAQNTHNYCVKAHLNVLLMVNNSRCCKEVANMQHTFNVMFRPVLPVVHHLIVLWILREHEGMLIYSQCVIVYPHLKSLHYTITAAAPMAARQRSRRQSRSVVT